jgi:hypothetical protein
MRYPILFSSNLPQANNVARLFQVIDLVHQGRWRYIHLKHELDITHRQGQYYKDATEILNLTDREHLTEKGQLLHSLGSIERRIFMKDTIMSSKVMIAYLSVKTSSKKTTFQLFKELIAPNELSDTTIKRRISTLEAWLSYCKVLNSDEINLENIDQSNIILIEKDEHKSEEARINHEKLVQLMIKTLSGHDCDVFEDRLVDVVYKDEDKLIFFEMKSITEDNKGNQLKKALGQLIFYKNYYCVNSVDLVVVTDSHFDHIDILKDDPIHIVWRDGERFDSDTKTKSKLKELFSKYE